MKFIPLFLLCKQPSCLPSLLGYMSIIARASQKFLWPSWVVYDQNFRQEAASCGNYEWARVDPGNYTLNVSQTWQLGRKGGASTACQSIDHTSAWKQARKAGLCKSQRRPGAALVPPPQKRAQMVYPDDYCIKFNRFKGDCKFGKACTAKTSWLFLSTTEWFPWLQTNWRDSGYGRFALLLETNSIRQSKGQLPRSSYNHNTLKTLITSVLPSSGYMFHTATLKCICNASFTDVLRVVSACVVVVR